MRRTWTNGQIHLPMQAQRGSNRTVIGATGGNANRIFSMCSVVRRTNKESVLAFLKKLFRRVRHPLRLLTITFDNHTSHHSRLVTAYLASKGVEVLFTPPYSSPLNLQEYVWGLFKLKWARALSGITAAYDHANFERDIALIMDEVIASLTLAFLSANEKYLRDCMSGVLA